MRFESTRINILVLTGRAVLHQAFRRRQICVFALLMGCLSFVLDTYGLVYSIRWYLSFAFALAFAIAFGFYSYGNWRLAERADAELSVQEISDDLRPVPSLYTLIGLLYSVILLLISSPILLGDPDEKQRKLIVEAINLAPSERLAMANNYSLYEGIESGVIALKSKLKTHTISDLESAARNRQSPMHAEAAYLIGVAKILGYQKNRDLPAARVDMKTAALAGFPRAVYALGQMLYTGTGGKVDEAEGLSWWELCHRDGHVPCTAALGRYYAYPRNANAVDLKLARQLLNEASSRGHPGALATLGDLASTGFGEPKNFDKANSLYEKSAQGCFEDQADRCSSWGLRSMANAYRWGAGVAEDKGKAVQHLMLSASFGNDVAAAEVAEMLITGEGVEEDTELATEILLSGLEASGAMSTSKLVFYIVNEKIPAIEGLNLEALAIYADDEEYPDGIKSLSHALSFGNHGYEIDHVRAARLANIGLVNYNTREIFLEGAWPMQALSLATVLRRAIASGEVSPADIDISLDELESLYGSNEGMKRFTIPSDCGLPEKNDFHFYVWDSSRSIEMLKKQIEWLEAARGCSVDEAVIESFESLFEISRENGTSFKDLAAFSLENAVKK